MKKLPAFQFYPGDHMKDPALSMCSPATRGIWMDLICAMHERDRTGKISGPIAGLARLCRCTAEEMSAALDEINATETGIVSHCNGVVTVVNRRMQNEHIERLATAERVREHRSNADVAEEKRENTEEETEEKRDGIKNVTLYSSSSSSSSNKESGT